MSAPKHSHGNWTLSPGDGEFIIRCDGELVARVCGGNQEQDLANAKLIIAAPDFKLAVEGLLVALTLVPHVSISEAVGFAQETLRKVGGGS